MIYYSLYTDFTSKRDSVSSRFFHILHLHTPSPSLSLSNTFFLQRFLLQLLLPTFEVTSRPFRPSVISRRIGGSKPGRTFLPARRREEERESRRGHLKVPGTPTSYRMLAVDVLPDDECRTAGGKTPPKFRDYN